MSKAGTRIPNPLPRPLIVSLTSFPPRFPALHLALQSLVEQSVTPDAIVLWIAPQDMAFLPSKVRRMEGSGITIHACTESRSYKKVICALRQYPDCYIVTADDDFIYGRDWLRALVEATNVQERVIVCHRAHRVRLNEHGDIAPYLAWSMDVQDITAKSPSVDLLPTTGAGVLYPPDCFSFKVTDRAIFERLCPTADDLWLYWMSRKKGWKHKKVGGEFSPILLPTGQFGNLAAENCKGENDRQIRNLEREFGNPLLFSTNPSA